LLTRAMHARALAYTAITSSRLDDALSNDRVSPVRFNVEKEKNPCVSW